MFSPSKFSTKYALASLVVFAFLLLIYGISDGDYQPKPNPIPTKVKHNLEFRVVHLDLKGAPPRVAYYEDLFPYLRQQGASGILVEYEDMFPYAGPLLEHVPAFNAYSLPDIKEILKLARQNKLEVIPLIQTFGHLEFFLKLKNSIEMREVPAHPGSICPSHNKTLQVLQAVIDQVVQAHPGIRYLHIGCDEVYELGKCSRCMDVMKQHDWNRKQLFLSHVLKLAKYIRSRFPSVMPLMWEDMFRSFSEEELHGTGLEQLVEPVVWNYHPNVLMHIPANIWNMYAHTFKNIWIASAFKGATGPDQLLTNFTYHFENHMSWMAVVEQFKHQINFRGIMMTGWQRYDHFAVLCELLPVSIPSLVINLYYLQNYKRMHPLDLTSKAMELLECDVSYPPRGSSMCPFPGSHLLSIAQRLYLLREDLESAHNGIENSVVHGWVSEYNIKHNFSNPDQVQYATSEIDRFKMEFVLLKNDFRQAAADIFDHYTVDEWIEINIEPYEKKLDKLWVAREQLLDVRYWPRRPLNTFRDEH